jgi:hypothetical protein
MVAIDGYEMGNPRKKKNDKSKEKTRVERDVRCRREGEKKKEEKTRQIYSVS